jgi:hypothetical protein
MQYELRMRTPGSRVSLRAIARAQNVVPSTLLRPHRQPKLPQSPFKAPKPCGPPRKFSDTAEAAILQRIREEQEGGALALHPTELSIGASVKPGNALFVVFRRPNSIRTCTSGPHS